MAVYEYQTPAGTVRAYYQTQTTNGSQGYFENFMGDQGTLRALRVRGQQPRLALPRSQRPGLGRVGAEGLHLGAHSCKR